MNKFHMSKGQSLSVNKSVAKIFARYTLGVLLFLVAINAFAGGYYGMAGARSIPLEWLEGSPFENYFIPSLILFLLVGIPSLIASIAIFKRYRIGPKAALASGLIILIWLSIQIKIIGYVSWMQPTTAIAALAIFLMLTILLLKHDH